jgi:hypothetical protein
LRLSRITFAAPPDEAVAEDAVVAPEEAVAVAVALEDAVAVVPEDAVAVAELEAVVVATPLGATVPAPEPTPLADTATEMAEALISAATRKVNDFMVKKSISR